MLQEHRHAVFSYKALKFQVTHFLNPHVDYLEITLDKSFIQKSRWHMCYKDASMLY